jgi:hypothetical protein
MASFEPIKIKNTSVQEIKSIESQLHQMMELQAKDIAQDITSLERKINEISNSSSLQSQLTIQKQWAEGKFSYLEATIELLQSRGLEETDGNKVYQIDRADLKILENKMGFELQMLQDELNRVIKHTNVAEKQFDSRIRMLEQVNLNGSVAMKMPKGKVDLNF